MINQIKYTMIFTGLIILLQGCATPYQKMGLFGEGYNDVYLGDNTYVIEVKVNEFTGTSTAYTYFNRRVSEIKELNGYDEC